MSGEGILNPEALYQNNCVLNMPLTGKTSGGKVVTVNGNAILSTAVASPITGNKTVGYFGGNGYLSLPDSMYTFGTNDFTVETYINITTLPQSQHIYSFGENSSYYAGLRVFIIPKTSTTFVVGFLLSTTGTSWTINLVDTLELTINTNYHITIIRNQATIYLHINGIIRYSNSIGSSTTIYSGTKYTIGTLYYGASSYYLNGYLSELRVSNIARYTAAFTPQTTPFVNDVNTVLLLHMDGVAGSTQFIDSSTSLGTTVPDYSSKKHNAEVTGTCATIPIITGSNAMYFNGSTDYLTIPNTLDFNLSNKLFTLLFWIQPKSVSSNQGIFQSNYSTTVYAPLSVQLNSTKIGVYLSSSGTSWINSSSYAWTTTISTSTWYFIAIVRQSDGYVYGYINCVQDFSYNLGTSTTLVTPVYSTYIGSIYTTSAASYLNAYVKDMILLNGAAYSIDQLGTIMEATYIQ